MVIYYTVTYGYKEGPHSYKLVHKPFKYSYTYHKLLIMVINQLTNFRGPPCIYHIGNQIITNQPNYSMQRLPRPSRQWVHVGLSFIVTTGGGYSGPVPRRGFPWMLQFACA